MKQIILDTNFILSCVKQKIDFFEDLKFKGLKILIPVQVLEEIEKVANSKKKLRFREDAKLALKILGANKFEKIELSENYVDKGLIKYANENKNVVVATLDKEIKSKILNPKIVIKRMKTLDFV